MKFIDLTFGLDNDFIEELSDAFDDGFDVKELKQMLSICKQKQKCFERVRKLLTRTSLEINDIKKLLNYYTLKEIEDTIQAGITVKEMLRNAR